jgi:hypothetical protein
MGLLFPIIVLFISLGAEVSQNIKNSDKKMVLPNESNT